MSIAIIGTGNIGGTLGRAFARHGLDVRLGSRDPGTASAAVGDTAKVVTVQEALVGADVVVLAQPGATVADFLRANAAALDGKLVLDATNRLPGPVLNSAADVVALVPGARYARAFNNYGWEVYDNPVFDGVPADLPYTCEEADRETVEQLINAVGLNPVYLGGGQHDVLDAALRLVFPMFQTYGRRTALRYVHE